MKSPFMLDLGNLLNAKKRIDLHIRYRSYRYFQECDIDVLGKDTGRISWASLPPLGRNDTIAADVCALVRRGNEVYNKHKVERVLILQSHGYGAVLKTNNNAQGLHMSELRKALRRMKAPQFDAILLDSCCMASLDTLEALQGVCKFIVACQFTCPYLGIVSPSFLALLTDHRRPMRDRLASIADAFIARNTDPDPKWRGLRGKTDISVIDMQVAQDLLRAVKESSFVQSALARRRAENRVIRYSGYLMYDMMSMLRDAMKNEEVGEGRKDIQNAIKALKRTVVFYRRLHENGRCNGLSVELHKV